MIDSVGHIVKIGNIKQKRDSDREKMSSYCRGPERKELDEQCIFPFVNHDA
jgi:hypothetical protein